MQLPTHLLVHRQVTMYNGALLVAMALSAFSTETIVSTFVICNLTCVDV
jgi:hypothetical protein